MVERFSLGEVIFGLSEKLVQALGGQTFGGQLATNHNGILYIARIAMSIRFVVVLSYLTRSCLSASMYAA